jgi:hypothetical protein
MTCILCLVSLSTCYPLDPLPIWAWSSYSMIINASSTKDKIVGRGIRDSKTGLYRYLVQDPAFKVCTVNSPSAARLWHRRLGHLNQHSVRAMGAHDVACGVPLIPVFPDLCDSCLSGKQSHEPTRKESTRPRATTVLQFIHSDLCGEIRPASLGGNLYFISFIDDFSRYT